MRIAFLQTYPIYHDHVTTQQWLARESRDRWMPGILAAEGHEVELWAGAHEEHMHLSQIEGLGDYPIRLFRSGGGKRTKFHTSEGLVDHARSYRPDLVVLKGTDGGIGIRLLDAYLRPEKVPFVFVIGGKYYSRYAADAVAVLYETEAQRLLLMRPGFRLWRRAVPPNRLIRLPKAVDVDLFRPMPQEKKEWDVLVVSRLVTPYKNFDALADLPAHVKVAVAGSGPAEGELRRAYPQIEWLGFVEHADLPLIYNRARLFVHTGRRDFFPRVLAEAAACGLPCVGFADAITEDVLPPSWGLRVERREFGERVVELLKDTRRIENMRSQARAHAVKSFGKESVKLPMRRMLALLHHPQEAMALSP